MESKEVKVSKVRSVSLELDDELWRQVRLCAETRRMLVKTWVAESLGASVKRHLSAGVVTRAIPAGTYAPGDMVALGPATLVSEGSAAGDLEVKRETGGRSSRPRISAPAPVRLGQAASLPPGGASETARPMVRVIQAPDHVYQPGEPFTIGSAPPMPDRPPPGVGRGPEAVCRRCKIPWRNHQEGQFGNRAGLTGCTQFQD